VEREKELSVIELQHPVKDHSKTDLTLKQITKRTAHIRIGGVTVPTTNNTAMAYERI
jgi:hypothetical protein